MPSRCDACRWQVGFGAWRRLVAHSLGVRVVVGSNPAAPIVAKAKSEVRCELRTSTSCTSIICLAQGAMLAFSRVHSAQQ